MKSIALFASLSAVLSTSAFPSQTLPQHATPSSLTAVPPSSGWGASSRGVPSKTARESAWTVEWEPMSELDRRIEDGVNYEHIPNLRNEKEKHRNGHQKVASKDDIPSARGVFCGYRYTKEEYGRLKSADPNQ